METKPIIIKKFYVGDNLVTFKEPLELIPKYSENKEYLYVVDEYYNIDTYDINRKTLKDAIQVELEYLYKEFALHEDDKTLTKDAQKVKYNLLKNTYIQLGDN